MKFLVTGCAGFIGGHTCEALLSSENDVIGLDSLTYASRSENIDKLRLRRGFSFHKNDICDFSSIKKIVEDEKISCIINFAAETHVDNSIKDVKPFISSNIEGVSNLIDVVKATGAALVHISTDEVYGVPEPGQTFTEESNLNPRNPYSATKAAADHLILSAINTFGISAKIIRPSNNFGPGQHDEKFIPTILRSVLGDSKIPVYGDGNQKREWTYVKDTAFAIAEFCKLGHLRDSRVVFNLSSEDQFTNLEIIKRICQILEKDPEDFIEFVKDRPGHDREYKIKNSILSRKTDLSISLNQTVDYYLENSRKTKRNKL